MIKGWLFMIRIVNEEIENDIILEKDYFFTFVIENKFKFYEYSKSLYEQCENEDGFFGILENNKIISFEKDTEIISDFLQFDLNNKRFLNNLNKNFLNFINLPENISKIGEVEKILLELFDDYKFDSLMNICSSDLQYQYITKLLDIKFSDSFNGLLDKLLNYIDISIQLKNIKVLFLLNGKLYFSNEELKIIFEYCQNNSLCLCLVENKDNNKAMDFEKKLIIDEDLCEIIV
jgi:CRISPR-associated protein Csn2